MQMCVKQQTKQGWPRGEVPIQILGRPILTSETHDATVIACFCSANPHVSNHRKETVK
jgi:hypothetical protein